MVRVLVSAGPGALSALAFDFVNHGIDVIVSGSASVTRALQQATSTIPIVMAASGDPVEQGFVSSLAHPGEAKAADLSVEQPTKFEFYLNLRTANAPGVVAAVHTLMRADDLIR